MFLGSISDFKKISLCLRTICLTINCSIPTFCKAEAVLHAIFPFITMSAVKCENKIKKPAFNLLAEYYYDIFDF